MPFVIRPSATAAAYPCETGYVQLEDQAWWLDATGEAWPGRHVHQQMCWPTGVVTGTLDIPVRVLLHAQPSGAKLTRLRATDGSGATLWSQTTNLGLPDANGDQTLDVTMRLATAGLSTGIHEIRVASITSQPNGNQQFVSSGHPLYVRSMSGGATSRNYHEARGWYTLFDYDNARTKTPLADFREMTAGETFQTQCASPSGQNGTGCGVFLDPNAHAGFEGAPILPWVSGEVARTATFPSVAPGLHKIAIRIDAKANLGSKSNGTNSGLLVITVEVP
jgi:hypothetical protein